MTNFSFSRRRLLKTGLGAVAVGSVGLATDATFIAPDRLRLERVEIQLAKLPGALDGFTIAQLSDFHYDPYFSITPIKAAIRMVNGLKPDLVVLTGDFLTMPLSDSRRHSNRDALEAMEPCSDLLRSLSANSGVFAILGNHDVAFGPEGVTDSLESHGIRILRNRSVPIERGTGRFWLAGLDDVLGYRAKVRETLQPIPKGEATVLLCHEPDYADTVAKHDVGLQISGHSHGGQIRFPLLGALYLPPMGKKYPWGLRRLGSMMLYTNCGLGTVNLPIRLNCPPEVTLFTLRSGDTGAITKEMTKEKSG